jgi:hypothetical protein
MNAIWSLFLINNLASEYKNTHFINMIRYVHIHTVSEKEKQS